jgi:hypothetical protein
VAGPIQGVKEDKNARHAASKSAFVTPASCWLNCPGKGEWHGDERVGGLASSFVRSTMGAVTYTSSCLLWGDANGRSRAAEDKQDYSTVEEADQYPA